MAGTSPAMTKGGTSSRQPRLPIPEITQQGAITGLPVRSLQELRGSIWLIPSNGSPRLVGIVALNTFIAVFMRTFLGDDPDYHNFG